MEPAVLGRPPAGMRRQRGPAAWRVRGAIVLFVAAAVIAHMVTASAVSAPHTPASPDGLVFVAAPLTGSVVLDRLGDKLYYTDTDRCVQSLLTASETATEVRLSYSVVRGVASCDRFGPPDQLPLPLGIPAQVQLAALLGGRSVIDASTGRPVLVIAETQVPALAKQPPDWSAALTWVASAFSDFGGPGTATAADGYTVEPAHHQSSTTFAMLWVVATTAEWHPPAGTVTRPVRVRGIVGQAAPGIVVWTVGRFTYAVRWDPNRGFPLLGTAALIAFANSLFIGGTS